MSDWADIGTFPDAASTHTYAKDSLGWAVGAGLVSGVRSGETVYLKPGGNASRAQIASILQRFCEKYGL